MGSYRRAELLTPLIQSAEPSRDDTTTVWHMLLIYVKDVSEKK